MNTNLIEFYNYIRPIVSGTAGFIRTDGYMLHYPGIIVLMNADESFVSIIKIPVIFDIKLVSIIGDFLKLKTDEEILNLQNNLYFIGWNIKESKLIQYMNDYNVLNHYQCEFQEDDCYNLQGFTEGMSSSEISFISVPMSDYRVYRIPVSKSITNAAKSDSVSIKIYPYLYNVNDTMIRTVKYTVFKKKFKLNVDIYCNIILL